MKTLLKEPLAHSQGDSSDAFKQSAWVTIRKWRYCCDVMWPMTIWWQKYQDLINRCFFCFHRHFFFCPHLHCDISSISIQHYKARLNCLQEDQCIKLDYMSVSGKYHRPQGQWQFNWFFIRSYWKPRLWILSFIEHWGVKTKLYQKIPFQKKL